MEQSFRGKGKSAALENLKKVKKLVLPRSRLTGQESSTSSYFHILNRSETDILFNNLADIFSKIFELELHKKKLRKKLKN